MSGSPRPRVVIITYCQHPETLYGSLLTFATVRTGLPTAQIDVVDNASLPSVRMKIVKAAQAVGANHTQLELEAPHHVLLTHAVATTTKGPLIICDPDIVFWSNVENWEFGSNVLAAGRLIPQFLLESPPAVNEARLHTSLLILPDVCALRAAIRRAQFCRIQEFHPFMPYVRCKSGIWHRHDTGATLYEWLKAGGRAHSFDEAQLNAYDHLISGTHYRSIADGLEPATRDAWEEVHAAARAGNLEMLRGIWRAQEREFTRRAVTTLEQARAVAGAWRDHDTSI